MSIRSVAWRDFLRHTIPSERVGLMNVRHMALESFSRNSFTPNTSTRRLLSDSRNGKISVLKAPKRELHKVMAMSVRRKANEEYLNDPRLEQGLPALGPKNFATALLKGKIPEITLNVNPESYVEVEHTVGNLHIKSRAPGSSFYVVLRDKEGIGCFYAGDTNQNPPVVDCLQIYNTDELTDKDKPHLFEIFWSKDGMKAALRIDQYFHAVFDFEENRGYCRTNFLPSDPDSIFGEYSHEWDDDCLRHFKA